MQRGEKRTDPPLAGSPRSLGWESGCGEGPILAWSLRGRDAVGAPLACPGIAAPPRLALAWGAVSGPEKKKKRKRRKKNGAGSTGHSYEP